MTIFVPERIVVAPSGFKESLSAIEVADAIAAGIRRVMPGTRVDTYPVPDGGEGTVDILAARPGAVTHTLEVTGPVGQRVTAHWVEFPARRLAVIEMASCAGLTLVPQDLRDPGATTTYGVGELLRHLLDRDIETIIVGCGDSGTSDGGAGALAALGVTAKDEHGNELAPGGAHLRHARSLDTDKLHPRLNDVDIILACNIHNVLTGKRGVARVFGPQKGATPQQVEELEAGLENFARLLHGHFQPAANIVTGPGSGASGGLGAGLMALGAQARNRFEVLLDEDLDELLAQADVVITAEGAIDFQTPRGKVPAEIARRCQDSGVPVLALAGSLGHGAPAVHDCGIAAIQSIMTVPMELSDAVSQGRPLLVAAAERAMRMLQLGCAVAGRTEAKLRERYHAPATVLPAA
ncbi:glycerate kinase [Corynebacterium sp. SA-MJD20WY100]|uniref:glycerate kinase family protein n=1 Tax=Corynebacterium sp. SA-MJD20WY100 TaxID=3142969 RepID=UPI003221926F